jgi:DNA repair protein RecO (recombination protein O)
VSGKQRIDGQRAYVLHAYPYSETSLVVDVFSRDHGRLPLLARGARRPRSAMRGLLMAFQPVELGWFGAGEVKTLAKAEWIGGMPLLSGRCLLLGYYLNELLVKMLPREDAHAGLFDAYGAALYALAMGGADAPELRRFEKSLLKELGYGLTLDREAETGERICGEAQYAFQIERGPIKKPQKVGADEATALQGGRAKNALLAVTDGDTANWTNGATFRGKTLLDMAADDYSDPQTRVESRALMRQLIAHHLGGKPLQSRRVFMELQEL